MLVILEYSVHTLTYARKTQCALLNYEFIVVYRKVEDRSRLVQVIILQDLLTNFGNSLAKAFRFATITFVNINRSYNQTSLDFKKSLLSISRRYVYCVHARRQGRIGDREGVSDPGDIRHHGIRRRFQHGRRGEVRLEKEFTKNV